MDLEVQLERERQKFRSIQQIARAVGSTLDLDVLLHLIMEKITGLMEADRSTLYVMDETRTELWTKVIQADEIREIRLKVGEGVAGWVAVSGETVNIEDAYQDQRFNPDVDSRSGYRTRSILCTPMKDNLGQIIGVVQVLNKNGGVFTEEDEELLEALVSQAGIAIENSQLYLSVVRKNVQLLETQEKLERHMQELDLLLEVEKQTSAASFLDDLLDGLLARTSSLIGAEAASILLLDQETKLLQFSSALGEKREAIKQTAVAMGEGISGWVAQYGKPLIVNDPGKDSRHNKGLAAHIGLKPRNILCVPLMGNENNTLGAIELLNKVGRDQFDDGDLTLLTLIAGRIAQAVEVARYKEDQIKQSHLASIGQMISGVLHDLKTPMTIISGYAQLMAHSEELKIRQEYAEQILKQFDLMAAMTKEVLAFARGESNILIRKVYLHKFMEEIVEHLKHEFSDRRIELFMAQRYRGIAYMDENKFRRVFHNIALNAAQAMPNGGKFTITVDTIDDKLQLTFKDTGTGIPSEMEGRIFKAFATAGKKDGTGLGLAIVQKIVHEHHGEITYESTAQGTTFIIVLPLKRAPTGSDDQYQAVNS